jgi:glycosyltransferase involved in cell wall biosynthesis
MEPISIVIRAWNEAAKLKKLLQAIAEQDYPGSIELIIVDNGSTDDTTEVARSAHAKVVHLAQAEFSYPKSLNVGIAAASHEVVVEVVAHALPINKAWLTGGIRHLVDPSVAGVYAPVKAVPKASLAERLLYDPAYRWAKLQGGRGITKLRMGVFGATNIVVRRSLWEQHHFDERYGAGGEDGEWATWALEQGYKIICDPAFAVYHSHGLSAVGAVKQLAHWSSFGQPRDFHQEELKKFRSDIIKPQ